MLQYFMKNFGCRRIAITLMKDFFFSMSQLFQQTQRIDNFLAMCGANCLKLKLNVDMHEYLAKNKVGVVSNTGRLQDSLSSFSYFVLYRLCVESEENKRIRIGVLHA